MHIYFKKTLHFAKRKLQLSVKKFGNSLPGDVKDLTSFPKFTEFTKTWYGPECKCNI